MGKSKKVSQGADELVGGCIPLSQLYPNALPPCVDERLTLIHSGDVAALPRRAVRDPVGGAEALVCFAWPPLCTFAARSDTSAACVCIKLRTTV